MINISNQHHLAKVLTPTCGRVGLYQQTAGAAGVIRIAKKGQVRRIRGEIAVGQGIEPGGWCLSPICARSPTLGLSGVLNPNATSGIADGIGREWLRNRQPTIGVAVAVDKTAQHLRLPEAISRDSRGITLKHHAAVDILELQWRRLYHICRGDCLGMGLASGKDRRGVRFAMGGSKAAGGAVEINGCGCR